MKTIRKQTSLLKTCLIVTLLVALLSVSMVGETGAWLIHTSGSDSTQMTKGAVSIKVNGSGGPAAAYVTNTGTVPAYIRVVPVVNWVNEQASNWNDGGWMDTRQYLARVPVKGASTATVENNDGSTSKADYTYKVRSADWLETTVTETVGSTTVSYTVLYYRKPLAVGANTTTMFESFTCHGVKSKSLVYQDKTLNYGLTTDFFVDAIQCETSGRISNVSNAAAVKMWGVTLSAAGGNITNGPTADFRPS